MQLITWNTKLVFTYALVEYEHEKYGRQEHFIWDTSLYRRAVGPSAGKEIQPIVKNTFKGETVTDATEACSQ